MPVTPTPAARKAFGRNGQQADFQELHKVGTFARAAGGLVATGAGLALFAGAAPLVVGGLAAAAVVGIVGGAAAQNGEGIARYFGKKSLIEEDKRNYNQRQADQANATSDALTALHKRVTGKTRSSASGVKQAARADIAKSLAAYQAKARRK